MKTITVVFFVLICISTSAQSLNGKWFMINRSGLIEFTISNDSAKSCKLTPELVQKPQSEQKYAIEKIVALSDRTLVIRKPEKKPELFSASVIIDINQPKYFQTAWNVRDTTFANIDELVAFHKKDIRKLFGYYAFSEDYLRKVQQLKQLPDMTLEEFRQFIITYKEKLQAVSADAEKYASYLSGFSLNMQIISQSLLDIGFNPIQNSGSVDIIFEKYMDDPSLQDLIPQSGRKKSRKPR
ncbi:hypothetical protein [Flavobacterium silvaticum]|uniref:Uncharacterized protein n=1 Tax=Flavobacterium silvaticum TaxID=1852020 RepID=A0A972JJ40_9FLAO|nr:hypothetical protein [Flavobacterium silvaticum]NMH27822.1 hypothetical protein [Flavobacterium silvaticum]